MKYFLLFTTFFTLLACPLPSLSPEERAHRATASILPLVEKLGLSRSELLTLSCAIEKELKQESRKGRGFQRVYGARTIEYDARSNHFFIHLGSDGDSLIEQGYYKRVTKSILYHETRPELVANCRGTLADQRELKITKRLQGLDGIVEARAFITHRTLNPGVELILKHYNAHSLRTIFNTKAHQFNSNEKLKIGQDILKGLASIHRKGYVHRDLHSGNYLVEVTGDGANKRVSAVITDFGKAMRKKQCRGISAQAALHYRSPESVIPKDLEGQDYVGTDIYAVGCVLYKLYFDNDPPWFQNSIFFRRKGLDAGRKKYITVKERASIIKSYTDPRRLRLKRKIAERKASKEERFEYAILSMTHPNPKMRKSARYWRDFIRL